MEIAEEWRSVPEDAEEERRDALLKLVKETVSHNMKHNAEVEACDLLIEIERLDLLIDFVEEVDHQRVCLYLLRYYHCSSFFFFFLTLQSFILFKMRSKSKCFDLKLV